MGLVLPDDWEKARTFLKTSMRNLRHDVDQLLRRPVENQPTLWGNPDSATSSGKVKYRVNAQVRAGQSVSGTILVWSGSAWTVGGTTATLHMERTSLGFHLNGDWVDAERNAANDRLEIISAGHHYIRGTLSGSLASGGSATMAVTVGGIVPSQNVTVHAPFTFSGTAIASGKIIGANWNNLTLQWEAVARQCN